MPDEEVQEVSKDTVSSLLVLFYYILHELFLLFNLLRSFILPFHDIIRIYLKLFFLSVILLFLEINAVLSWCNNNFSKKSFIVL